MKTVLAAAALAATMFAGSSLAVKADTIAFPGTTPNLVSVGVGSFTYDFTFSGPVSVDGISASASTKGVTFTNVSILGTGYSSSVSGPSFVVFPGIIAFGSTNTLEITGTSTNAKGKFNGNLTVSAVPLPTSVALFGTAVMGLGVAGALRRKGGKASVPAVA